MAIDPISTLTLSPKNFRQFIIRYSTLLTFKLFIHHEVFRKSEEYMQWLWSHATIDNVMCFDLRRHSDKFYLFIIRPLNYNLMMKRSCFDGEKACFPVCRKLVVTGHVPCTQRIGGESVKQWNIILYKPWRLKFFINMKLSLMCSKHVSKIIKCQWNW